METSSGAAGEDEGNRDASSYAWEGAASFLALRMNSVWSLQCAF